jgi:hypothetical protein
MNRLLALVLALVVATVTVSSACAEAPGELYGFTLKSESGNPAKIHAAFRDQKVDHDESWSSGFMPSELIGLDTSGFRSSGTRPLRFAVVREAGRLDCSGTGGGSYASGNCSFAPDPGFTQLLASRGIARPNREQAFGLMALNVGRELIDAIAAVHFPAPTADQLMALAALGVNGGYISEMARAGYRPSSIQSLVEFKAMGITGDWIRGFVQIGHRDIPATELMQLKAMNITPGFIAGFDRIGYRNLPVDTLIQLKALDITPEFIRSAVGQDGTVPPVHQLVEMKLFGGKRRR